MKWITAAAAIVALAGTLVDLVGKFQALEARAADAESRVQESRVSCGDAVSQLARFAAECSERCMGE